MLLREYSFLITAGEEIKPPISGFVIAYKSGDANTPVKVKTYDGKGTMLTMSNLSAGEKIKTPAKYETVILANETTKDLNCVFVLGSGEYQSDRVSGDVNVLTLPAVDFAGNVGRDYTLDRKPIITPHKVTIRHRRTVTMVSPTANENGAYIHGFSLQNSRLLTGTSVPSNIDDTFIVGFESSFGTKATAICSVRLPIFLPAGTGIYGSRYWKGGVGDIFVGVELL